MKKAANKKMVTINPRDNQFELSRVGSTTMGSALLSFPISNGASNVFAFGETLRGDTRKQLQQVTSELRFLSY